MRRGVVVWLWRIYGAGVVLLTASLLAFMVATSTHGQGIVVEAGNSVLMAESGSALTITGSGVTIVNSQIEGGAANCTVGGQSNYLLHLYDENGAPVWCDLTASPGTLQCYGDTCRPRRVLEDNTGTASRTDTPLSTVYDDGSASFTLACNPTLQTCDFGSVRLVNLDDPVDAQDAVTLASMRSFVTGSASATAHKGFATVQAESGSRTATSAEGTLLIRGRTANVDTFATTVNGVPVLDIAVAEGVPAAFALFVDKFCSADPAACGSITAPCCTINQALDRIQERNDNGFATCSGDGVTGCGRCSTSTGVQCNEDRDCPLNRCSTSALQCDRRSDCPLGETCGVVETCEVSHTACSDVGLGTCSGPTKAYGVNIGAGIYVENIHSDQLRPGSVQLNGVSAKATTIWGTGTSTPPDGQEAMNPDECVIDLTNTSIVGVSRLAVFSFAANGICSFGDMTSTRLEYVDFVHFGSEAWDYWEGPSRDGRFHGRNINTRTFIGLIPSGFGNTASGNGVHFAIAHKACSESINRACDTDADCPPTETCSLAGSGDISFSLSPSFIQPSFYGGVALHFEAYACGSNFNFNFDNAVVQSSESSNPGRRNVGIKMSTKTCEGPLNPANTAPGRIAVKPTLRTSNDIIRGNAVSTGFSDPDVSIWLADYSILQVGGVLAYDPCTRIVEPNAAIVYARPETIVQAVHTGGMSYLGVLNCDAPSNPQDGEMWAVSASSGTSKAGSFRWRAGGVTRDLLAGTFDESTGATQFAGDITSTANIDVGGTSRALVVEGNGFKVTNWDWFVRDYESAGRSLHGVGLAAEPANDNCDQQGRGCSWVEWDQFNETEVGIAVPTAATWTPTITSTPTVTGTPTGTPTPSPTSTAPTLTPTSTPTPTSTRTSTPTSNGDTPTATRTFTITKTATPTFTGTITRTPTAVPTSTRAPEGTPHYRRNFTRWGFLRWWVGDVSKNYGAASNTPTIECDSTASPAYCDYNGSTANNPNVAHVGYVKTAVAAITPPPTPVPTPGVPPTPLAWFHLGGRHAAAVSTTVNYGPPNTSALGATEAVNCMPVKGEIECDYLSVVTTALAASETVTVTLRDDSANASPELTCTITSPAASCSQDLGGSPAVIASGSCIALAWTCSGAGCPTAAQAFSWGLRCRNT